MTDPAVRLSEAQIRLLRKLDHGHIIVYSRDGDLGWLFGTNEFLEDADIWALRDRNYISQEHDEREDDYGCDKITDAGRAALTQGRRTKP